MATKRGKGGKFVKARARGVRRRVAVRTSKRGAGIFSIKAVGRGGFYSLMKKVLPTRFAGAFKGPLDLIIIGEVGNVAHLGTRHMTKTGIDIGVATALDLFVVPKLLNLTGGGGTSSNSGSRTN